MSHFQSNRVGISFQPTTHDLMGLQGIPVVGCQGLREQSLAWLSVSGYQSREVSGGHFLVRAPGGSATIHLYGERELAAFAYREGMGSER